MISEKGFLYMKTVYVIKNKRFGKNLYPLKQTFDTWFEADSYLQTIAVTNGIADVEAWLNEIYNHKNDDLDYLEQTYF